MTEKIEEQLNKNYWIDKDKIVIAKLVITEFPNEERMNFLGFIGLMHWMEIMLSLVPERMKYLRGICMTIHLMLEVYTIFKM